MTVLYTILRDQDSLQKHVWLQSKDWEFIPND